MKLRRLFLTAVMVLTAAAMTGCGGNDDKDKTESDAQANVSLSDITEAVKKAYGEDYIPDMEYDDIFIKETLGLDEDDYEQIVAEGPLVSFHIDNYIAVKAKSGKGDLVEQKLNAYRDYLINDTMMYPVNAVKIQASKVVRHGDYVFFICLGTVDTDTQDKGDEAILEKAQENNKLAVDAINKFFE